MYRPTLPKHLCCSSAEKAIDSGAEIGDAMEAAVRWEMVSAGWISG